MFEFLLGRHISDTTLIQYRAGLLDKKRFDMLEAHLMVCPTCQLQLLDLLAPEAALGLSSWSGGAWYAP
jgi:hypothetical protein